jgi:tyrosyl-tRNA synthetase
MVGDPSGRASERKLAEEGRVQHDAHKLKGNVERFFKRAMDYAVKTLPTSNKSYWNAEIHDNMTWTKDMGLLEFLRKVGAEVRVNTMLNRERRVHILKTVLLLPSTANSVQARFDSHQGISFTEFSYQLLQGYDFYMLYKLTGCTIQIGGSDQWGNILTGIDLINRLDPLLPNGKPRWKEVAHGITTPLLETASGEKFGKSAGNAVWLDENLTSVFDFYQVRLDDIFSCPSIPTGEQVLVENYRC